MAGGSAAEDPYVRRVAAIIGLASAIGVAYVVGIMINRSSPDAVSRSFSRSRRPV